MLNDISKFRFYAHKVLPLVYDDSLSYYEFLCKVVAKLNEVIDLADQQNSTIDEIVEDVEDFEAETNTKYNQFVAQIEEDLEAFETEMRTAQNDFETEISGEMTEFEGTMQDLYDEFLANYQRTFGIQDSFGESTTDAISQACVSQLIDYTGETPFVKGANLPIDDTTSAVDKLWSSDKIEDEIGEVNTDLSADITALGTRMTTAEGDIDTLESGLTTANNNISGLNTVTTTLAGQVAGIAGSQELLNGRVGTLETSVGTLSSDVTSLSTQVTQMDTDVDNLQDDMLEAQTDIETAEGKIETLEGKVSTLEDDVDAVESDITTIEGSITTLGNSITYEGGRIDGLNTRIGEAETDINDVQDDVSEAQANIGNLTSSMDTAEDDIDALEERMNTAEDDIDSLETRVGTAEDDIDSLETRMTTAENDIDSLEENKAIKSGYENQLVSGGSKGLYYGIINDNSPYNFRATPFNVGVFEKLRKIVYGSVVVNQIAKNDTPPTSRDSLTITPQTYSFKVSGSSSNTSGTIANGWLGIGSDAGSPSIEGHKVFVSVKLKSGTATGGTGKAIEFEPSLKSSEWVGLGESKIISVSSYTQTQDANSSIKFNYGWTFTDAEIQIVVCDLTKWYGSTETADHIYAMETNHTGNGVDFFIGQCPQASGYIPYNTGTLASSKPSFHKTSGLNWWDEEWEGGYYDVAGAKAASSNFIRSKNNIKVIGGLTYAFTRPAGHSFYVCQYDIQGNFISRTSLGNSSTLLLGNNTAFITFCIGGSGTPVTTYGNNICITLHWDSTMDGVYEPFIEHTYPFDSTASGHGIFKFKKVNNVLTDELYVDGDTYAPDGTFIANYGIVDLSTLAWTGYDVANGIFYGVIPSSKVFFNGLTTKYAHSSATGLNSIANKEWLSSAGAGTAIWIKDTEFNDYTSTQVKTALSGIYFIYELATPTTSQKEPYTEEQMCNNWGFEYINDAEYDEGNRSVQIPVGHETIYDHNIAPALYNLISILPTTNGDYLLNVNNGVYSFQSSNSRSVETLTPIEKIKEEKTEITSEEIPEERSEENEEDTTISE